MEGLFARIPNVKLPPLWPLAATCSELVNTACRDGKFAMYRVGIAPVKRPIGMPFLVLFCIRLVYFDTVMKNLPIRVRSGSLLAMQMLELRHTA